MDIKHIMYLLYHNASLAWLYYNYPGTNLENCISVTYEEKEFIISKEDKEVLDEVLIKLKGEDNYSVKDFFLKAIENKETGEKLIYF